MAGYGPVDMSMRVNGLPGVLADIQGTGRKLRQAVVQETETTRRLISYEAKQNVRVDTGKARQSISDEAFNGGLGGRTSCNVEYAGILEFGTGGLVEIPDGWAEVAGSYKGSGKRKVNLPARPFMIPAWLKYRERYYQRLKKLTQNP